MASDKFHLFLTMPVCAKYMVYKKDQLMVKAAKHTTLSSFSKFDLVIDSFLLFADLLFSADFSVCVCVHMLMLMDLLPK